MRKAIRKAISALLVVIVIFASVPLAGFVGLELPELNLFSTKAEAEDTATSGTCGENLTWILNEATGELVISGTGNMTNWTAPLSVPWYNCYSSIKSVTISDGVTSIGEIAFYDCTSLESVTIPDSVTSIGDGGFFNCESLTNTIISNNVAFIGDYAFYNCESLTNITISDNVEFIGDYAFSECYSLKSIIVDPANAAYSSDEYGVLFNKDKTELIQYSTGNLRKGYIVPDGVTNIGDGAFDDCNDIRSITIPDGVTNIGDSAFNSCDGLKSITIPDSVTSIGDDAFSWCYSLANVYYTGTETEWNAISIGTNNHCLTDATVYYNCIKEILIDSGTCGENLIWEFYEPTGELVISGTGDMTDWSNHSETPWYKDYDFRNNIKKVTISNGVTSIGSYAFYDCSCLTNVTIPKSVTSIGSIGIGNSVFDECDSLTSIIVDSANTAYSSDGYGVLFNKDKTELIRYPEGNEKTSYVIPDSVTRIGDGAFCACYNLESITIPETVTTLGIGAFFHCVGLTSVTMPDSITSISDCVFLECLALTSVTLPDNLTSIGEYAFCSCSSITSITIPTIVTTIGEGAFQSCTELSNVYYLGAEEQWNGISIGIYNAPLLDATINFNYAEKPALITGTCGDNLTWALDESTGELVISGTGDMHNYGDEVAPWFEYYEIIKSIEISDKVTSIGDCAFGGCENLENVSIGNNVKSIGYAAFNYCLSLTSVAIPDSVTSIGAGAFADCPDITSAVIGNSVITIGDGAFANCQGLTSITIPDSVTSIGQSAFYNCSFTSITVGSANTSYSNDEYGVLFNKDKTELILYPVGNERASYEIPDGVTSITDYAFQYCTNLTSITIPDSVTSIGENTFGSCTGLISITMPDSITDIPYCAFEFCDNLTNVVIGNNVTSIGKGAFYDCENLASVVIPDSVTSIDNYAFNNCNSLADVYYTGTEEEWNAISIGLYNNEPLSKATIHYNYITEPEKPLIMGTCGDNLTWTFDESTGELVIRGTGAMTNWDSDTEVAWYSQYLKIKTVSFPQGLTNIGDYAFYNSVNLTSVIIPDSVMSIGAWAFYSCDRLTSITIPDNVTSISQYAFSCCENLVSVTLSDSVATIGEWAFEDCERLETVTFGKGVTSIARSAFYDCRKLTNITLPDSVTSIGDYAFYNCESFTSIKIPDSVTNIGYRVFHSCDSLASITVDSKNTAYSNDEYGVLFNKDKTTLIHYPVAATRTSYVIPDSVTSTSNLAFANCLSLESITIGNNLKNIGDRAFVNCENLKSIIIPDGVAKIGDYTFSNCKSLTSITIPKTVKKIGYSVFNGCQSLADVYYTGTEKEWNAVSIGVSNENLLKATIHYCYGCEHSYVSEVTTEVTCTENGVETFTCNKCGDVYTEVIPSNGHTRGEWEIVIESTTETEGKKIKKCLSCGETVEKAIIPRNTVITDDKTGIGVEINRDDYDGEAQVAVEETSDDSVFNIVNTETNAVRTKIYDINITVDGKEIQPKGTVKVRIPLPDGYNPLYTVVYHVDTVTSTIEHMDAVVETINGKMYLVFETTHFSYYAIVDKSEITMSIRTPSATTIKCGDSIVLHADVSCELPNGYTIDWIASNNNFSYSVSSDGTTCTITPSKSGDTTFTAVVCDAKGNAVSADEQTMTSKAGFFDKIIAFFKKLFGLTKTFPQAFKGIY